MELIEVKEKIHRLNKILIKASNIKNENKNTTDVIYKEWRNYTTVTLIDIYGKDSHEVKHFEKCHFYYYVSVVMDISDEKHLEYFEKDLELTLRTVKNYIEILEDSIPFKIEKISIEKKKFRKFLIKSILRDLMYSFFITFSYMCILAITLYVLYLYQGAYWISVVGLSVAILNSFYLNKQKYLKCFKVIPFWKYIKDVKFLYESKKEF